eukprot:Skav209580  [mRNA]  locus=scaffold281:255902:265931:+ [translate_table: standard]
MRFSLSHLSFTPQLGQKRLSSGFWLPSRQGSDVRQQAHPLQALSSRLRFATETPSWVVYLPQELQDRIGAAGRDRSDSSRPGGCHSFGIAFETIMKEKGSYQLRSPFGSWWSQRVQRAFDEAVDQEELQPQGLELHVVSCELVSLVKRLAMASELRGGARGRSVERCGPGGASV